MRFSIALATIALAAPFVGAVTVEQKPVILSYPSNTEPSIIEEAKAAIIEAGGQITHEFNLIKGFAAKAPAKILESIQALEAHSGVMIEEDKVIKVNSA